MAPSAKLDEARKRRIAASLIGTVAPLDTRRLGRLEQELRTLALDSAFGRVSDDDLPGTSALAAEIEEVRQPHLTAGMVEPARALASLENLKLRPPFAACPLRSCRGAQEAAPALWGTPKGALVGAQRA